MNENQVCGICRNNELNTIFNGNIRDGSYGKLSSSSYKVFQCSKCKVRFLDKFVPPEAYESGEYRKDYCGSNLLEIYRKNHDELWNNKLHRIGIHNCRGKSIADFGAGGGAFLDALQGVAKETIAIEPTQHWQESLSKKHRVFSYGKELVKTGIKINIGVSFDVIEHVPDPEIYLKEIHNSLYEEGKLFLMTPNSKEILFDLAKECFEPFYFRTAHSYYFCEDSMKSLLKQVGFKSFKICYYHEMDISNLIFWLRSGEPTGKKKNSLFNEEANKFFCAYLEKTGKASHLWVEAEKG